MSEANKPTKVRHTIGLEGKHMKIEHLILALVMSLFLAHAAFCQEDTMVLNHKEAGPHQRPLVTFDHALHATDKIDCITCHHEYDQYGNNKGGEDKAQSCANCHSNPANPNKRLVPLTDAFHAQCKKCHESLLSAEKASGPIMCGECHIKKQ